MLGVLGGTFDPIHNGHLRLAIEFYERLDLTELRLIPLRAPSHRDPPLADPEHRLAMLQLAIENITGLTVDDCELQRGSTSYTIETVSLVKEKIGDSPLCLLMGIDAFAKINTWHRWEELLEYVHIVIADRPGNHTKEYDQEIAVLIKTHLTDDISELQQSSAGKIYRITMPMLDISATQIRNLISNNQDAHGLVSEKVLDFIHLHNLYKTNT